MRHDLSLDPEVTGWDEMTRREKVKTWVAYYWWPTRRWVPTVERWWDYNVLRIPKPPPIEQDRVALHFGFVEGVPPCTDGPVCAEHGWKLSPLVEPKS
jgi:hypothetical protein